MASNIGLSLSDTASETTATGPRSPSSTLYSSDDDAATVATPEVWNADESVLVTGGAGFVGSHVAEYLLRRGEKVLVIDELNAYYDVAKKQANIHLLEQLGGRNFRFFKGDICDKTFLAEVEKSCKFPKRVIHLAARAGVRPSIDDPFVYVHSNVEGTTRLLELAGQAHGNDAKFVFASSSSVYGGSKKQLFSETDAVDAPVSPYAATKKACELLAYTYHHLYGMHVAGLRFFTVFGPRGRPDMAPLKFVDKVSRGVPIDRYGDGSSSRDYTYIDDVVDGVIRALDTPLGYQIYNLGNGRPTRLNDFIRLVEQHSGKEAIINVMPEQPGDVPRTCADISKARELLGYDPQTPFSEGIAKLVKWYNESQRA